MSTQLQRVMDGLYAPGGDSVYVVVSTGAIQSITLTQQQLDVEVRASDANDITLTLPDASKCKGKFASVYLTQSSSADIIVVGPGVGTDYTSADIDATGDHVVLYSNGFRWIAIHTAIA